MTCLTPDCPNPALVITVPALPPNPNRASRNLHVSRRDQKEYATLVRYAALDARNRWEGSALDRKARRWPTLASATITVSFVVGCSRRGPLPDYANLVHGMKLAIDELTARNRGNGRVGIGLIMDDSPECLTWDSPAPGEQVIRKGDESLTVIRIRGI